MTIIKRKDLGRPLTWDELDNNFEQVDTLVSQANVAVETATTQALAATSAASDAALSSQNAQDAATTAGGAAAAAVQGIYDDFASTDVAKGASLIGMTNGNNVEENINDIISGPNGSSIESYDSSEGSSFYTLYTLLGHQSDSGNYFGAQDFCFNEVDRKLYTLILSGSGSSDLATINEFSMDVASSSVTSSAHTTPASNLVGHQGLAFESLQNGFRLWTTAYRESGLYTGRHAVRYTFVSGGAVSNAEQYLLFGSDFLDSTSCTPAIDPTGKYLVAHGTKTTGSFDTRIRVFDLASLVSGGPGDYSSSYLREFSTSGLVNDDFPLQGLATDGAVVVASAGNSDISQNKKLYWYDLWTGKPIFKNDSFNVGKSNSSGDGAGTRHEPEGLCFIKDGGGYSLIYGVVSGDTGARVTRLYAAGKPLERFKRGLVAPDSVSGIAGNNIGNVFSGLYTPVLTNIANVASSTVFQLWYSRIGNVVTVSGEIGVTPTTASTVMQWELSLPIASDFTFAYHLAGTAINNVSTAAGLASASIFANSTDDAAQFRSVPPNTNAQGFFFNFSYYIR